MKFSGSKKSIVILIAFILLLLFFFFIITHRDVISNGLKYDRWFTLDKYEKSLEDCDWKKDGKEIRVTCNALLYVASEADNEMEDRCYNFLTISKKDKNKKPEVFNICEKDSNVKWNSINQWLKEREKLTPVRYNLVFKSKNLINFTYDRLEVQNATPSELFDEFYLNTTIKALSFSIASKYSNKESYNNYVYVEKNTFGIEEIGHIYFFDAKLIEKTVENNVMYFTFETRINDQNIKLKTHTNGFILMKEVEKVFTQESITKDNIDKIEIDHNYQFRFFYLVNKTDNFNNKVKERCNSDDIQISMKPLCDNKEEILMNDFEVTSIDEILKNLKNGNTENIVNIDNGILYILNI